MSAVQLAIVQSEVSRHMDEILALFKPGAKITVTVRTPDNDLADFLMTNEQDLESAIALIRRSQVGGAAT